MKARLNIMQHGPYTDTALTNKIMSQDRIKDREEVGHLANTHLFLSPETLKMSIIFSCSHSSQRNRESCHSHYNPNILKIVINIQQLMQGKDKTDFVST
jgi:hypothetical protein